MAWSKLRPFACWPWRWVCRTCGPAPPERPAAETVWTVAVVLSWIAAALCIIRGAPVLVEAPAFFRELDEQGRATGKDMNLHQVASSPRTMRLGMLLSQQMPEFVGKRLAWWTAGVVCRFRPAVYRIVRSNLSQVLGAFAEEQALEETVRRVFYSAIRSHYDLYRALRLPQEKLASVIDFPETAQTIARSLWHREGGSVLVFPHLGNFDLAGQAIGTAFPEMQLISLADPPPGFQLANELRQRSGIRITPLSSTALREAIRLLRRGGTVSIAGDRPVSELDEPVSFFGHPARVPSGHVRLALKTGAVIVTGCCFLSPETQRYTMHLDPPLELVRTGNRDEEIQINMRQVIQALEAIIRRWPDQWQMFVPVWPELLEAGERCAS